MCVWGGGGSLREIGRERERQGEKEGGFEALVPIYRVLRGPSKTRGLFSFVLVFFAADLIYFVAANLPHAELRLWQSCRRRLHICSCKSVNAIASL